MRKRISHTHLLTKISLVILTLIPLRILCECLQPEGGCQKDQDCGYCCVCASGYCSPNPEIYDPELKLKFHGSAKIPELTMITINKFLKEQLGAELTEPISLEARVMGADCCIPQTKEVHKFSSKLLFQDKESGVLDASGTIRFGFKLHEKPVVLPNLPPLGVDIKINLPSLPGKSKYIKVQVGLFFTTELTVGFGAGITANSCSGTYCLRGEFNPEFLPFLDGRLYILYCDQYPHIGEKSEACDGVGGKVLFGGPFQFQGQISCEGMSGGIYIGPGFVDIEFFFAKSFLPTINYRLTEFSKIKIL